MRSQTDTWYFKRRADLSGYEYISTDRSAALADYIGETLTTMFCDCDNDLELVRFHRYGLGETVIAHRLPSHIKLTITRPKYEN